MGRPVGRWVLCHVGSSPTDAEGDLSAASRRVGRPPLPFRGDPLPVVRPWHSKSVSEFCHLYHPLAFFYTVHRRSYVRARRPTFIGAVVWHQIGIRARLWKPTTSPCRALHRIAFISFSFENHIGAHLAAGHGCRNSLATEDAEGRIDIPTTG